MALRRYKDKGVIYIMIAIFCLSIFFLGYKITYNLTSDRDIDRTRESIELKQTDKATIEEEKYEGGKVVGALSNNPTVELKYNAKNELYIDENNFFLKVLLNCSTYMKLVLEQNNDKDIEVGIVMSSIKNVISSIKPDSYFKAQLPSIINILDFSEASSANMSNLESENKPLINYSYDDNTRTVINDGVQNNTDSEIPTEELRDIILVEEVEDPTESNEGDYFLEGILFQGQKDLTGGVSSSQSSDWIPKPANIVPININVEKPYALIYHTHGTESYLPAKEGNFHTTRREYNVLTIGDIVSNQLLEKGHNIEHIDKYHDLPTYNQSYERSLSTARDIMGKEKELKLIFDIHRDAVDESSDNKSAIKRFKTEIDGQTVARFSLVVGSKTPNKDKIQNFAKYIESVSNAMYPGLCQGIIVKPYGKFNQYLSDYYALIEIGSNINTIEESKETAKLVGNILDKVMLGIKK